MSDPVVPNLHEHRQKLLEQLGERAHAYPGALEADFPHIIVKLALDWGTPEIDRYLGELLHPGQVAAMGFSPAVQTELFQLTVIHGALALPVDLTTSHWKGLDSNK